MDFEKIKTNLAYAAVIIVLGGLNWKVYEIDKAVGEAKCSGGSKWSAALLFIVSFLIGVITACAFGGGCTSNTGFEHYLIPATLLIVIVCSIGLLAECSKVEGVSKYIGSLLAISILLLGAYFWMFKETYRGHLNKISGGSLAAAPAAPAGAYRHFPRGRF